ncbi:MAG: FAD-linked oxidase C-terminal domain-containing protein [Bacteroidota bacterium]
MAKKRKQKKLKAFALQFEGEVQFDDTSRLLYATDASSYRQVPIAVTFPKTVEDIKRLVEFANKEDVTLIPRAAGTSLAGQVVGRGIVVDITRHFGKILEYNDEEKWVRVQPGVIRDDLNRFLKPYGVFFAPETSTANRAMMGGMIGNNSCGANSVVYNSTREHTISVDAVLSDGSEAVFKDVTNEEFQEKVKQDSLEGKIYNHINQLLSDDDVRRGIEKNYPDPEIPRRNTGYALDLLMKTAPFNGYEESFNFSKLIAGSEGTLAMITEAKLNVVPLPPPRLGLICVHFDTIYDSMRGAQVAMQHSPSAVELMDHYILESTRNNITYSKYMFFVKGEPKAILVIEVRADDDETIQKKSDEIIADLKAQGLGYHYPIVWNEKSKLVWDLRKAGLGLLSNMPGDSKPVPVVEDTAVKIEDLAEYIDDFNKFLAERGLDSVHYAHAGSGEIHLRPIVNLKTVEGNLTFREVAEGVSKLVKKYNGSLSGEHGDGRLRGEFIPFMLGEDNYQHLIDLKKVWDPNNVFNKDKIINTPSMNTNLRYKPGHYTPEYETMLDFSRTLGIVRAAEQCNGSGDCRKSKDAGGTMCPSFMATMDEKHSTRARANIFREIAGRVRNDNPFLSDQIKDVFDLCLMCKGCKSECPSNVDITKIKMEFLYQYQSLNGVPFRSWLIGNYAKANSLMSFIPWAYNGFVAVDFLARLFKKMVDFAPERSLPRLSTLTFKKWFRRNKVRNFDVDTKFNGRTVLIFADEFTNFNDLSAGQAVVLSLAKLGYDVQLSDNADCGRSFLSKGMLDEAKVLANLNINTLKGKITEDTPLVGIEPSAILSFRDEYIDLAEDKDAAKEISKNALLFEEFIDREIKNERIDTSLFKPLKKTIKYHGHCQQKALSDMSATQNTLSLIPEATVEEIPSGCCGMAGAFGYEKEHYDLSMKIGEMILFPAVRSLPEDGVAVAAGTSCRHQIKDGTDSKSFHPAEILWESLK